VQKKNDIILVNTIAFHRGIKPPKKNRNCIIANYFLHPDFTYNNKFDFISKIFAKHFVNIKTKQKDSFFVKKNIILVNTINNI